MNDLNRKLFKLPPEQEAIRAKCFHPSGTFIPFEKDEVEQSIPGRFERIVRKYPDRIAVRTRNHTLTYDALNRMANRVARAIMARRGEGNEPVAVLFQAEAAVFPVTLGVWKAIKIHVPVDPLLPPTQIVHVLEQLDARLVITNGRCRALAEQLVGRKVSLIDIDELHAGMSTDNLCLGISPGTLAWIRFTSGSTGEPKGVTQNHRNILQYVRNFTNVFRICPNDKLLHPRFSTTTTGYQCALLSGASLYPLDVKTEAMEQLAQWMIDQSVTVFSSNPTTFRHFLDSFNGEERFPQLRLINLDGESVFKKEVERYKRHFSDNCILVNRFGSGETGSIRFFFIDKQTEIAGNPVPVGYPVNDTEILILNDDGKEAGANEVGQIAVKGRYLSPGYWRRPDLTAVKFVADPVSHEKRIYHTGDMGRLHPDGCLEHVGRQDFQVKIRGFKVEVGAVEAAISGLTGVKEAAVVAQDDGSGDLRLVAYIVASEHPPPNTSKVRNFLKERLPDYMIPAKIMILEALPLTATGKINGQALPKPTPTRPELDTVFVSPRTSVEEAMAEIWAQLLHLEPVGVYDNFFELGGHSLAAIRVVSQVVKQFQLEIPLQSLFQSPTVAEMAAVIMEHRAKKLDENDLERILAELESMSEEEAQKSVPIEVPFPK